MTINDNKFNIALANSGLTIKEAAERAEMSRARLAMILNQKRVTPQAVGRVARALGVRAEEIIDMED